MTIHDLPTPAVLVDRPRVLANIDRMQEAADKRGIRMRPHAKTHKSPTIARWQIDRGAVGICCAKLGEAEVFAASGFTDIRLPYPLNPRNAPRVLELLERTHLSFIVDHLDIARGWSRAMTDAGRTIDVLVKVDVGFHRCGIDPNPDTAIEFIQAVASLPGLTLRGLLSHAGHAYHAGSEAELQQIAQHEASTLHRLALFAREQGVPIDELSAGATPPARFSLKQDWLTEYRAGNYVYFDRTQVGLGAATIADCALVVLATVVSKPAAGRIVLDSGSKTLTSDTARGFSPLPGYGTILDQDNLMIERLSEEHAVVRVEASETPLEPGDRVRIVPNHSCVVSNLMDQVWLVDGEDVLEPMPIPARGKIT